MSDRFEKEYLRTDREDIENTSSPKEEAVWTKLEEKLDAKTIDCRKKVTPEMRAWFRDKFDHASDDCSILMKWEKRND